MNRNVERLAIVLSGGCERAGPWQAGVLAGMAEAGLDPRRAGALLGTSAGSLAVAHLALGDCAEPWSGDDPAEIPGAIRRAVSEALLPLLSICTRTGPRPFVLGGEQIPRRVTHALVVSPTPLETPADRRWNALLAARGVDRALLHASPTARAVMARDAMTLADARQAVAEGRVQGRDAAASLTTATRRAA